MTETTKTPNPLKQARHANREAKAVLHFLRGYLDMNRAIMSPDGRVEIEALIGAAMIRVDLAKGALAALKTIEVTK